MAVGHWLVAHGSTASGHGSGSSATESHQPSADVRLHRWWLEVAAPSRVRHPIEPAVYCRDVKILEVWTAEGAVARAAGWQCVLLQRGPVWREDGDARAGTAQLPATGSDDIAGRVPAHP